MNQQYLEKLNVYFKNDQFWTSLNDLCSTTEYGSLSDTVFSLNYLIHSLKCGVKTMDKNNFYKCESCLIDLKSQGRIINFMLEGYNEDIEIDIVIKYKKDMTIFLEEIVVYCDNQNKLFWADLETSQNATNDYESFNEMFDKILDLLGV